VFFIPVLVKPNLQFKKYSVKFEMILALSEWFGDSYLRFLRFMVAYTQPLFVDITVAR